MASRKGLISMEQSTNKADLPPVVSFRNLQSEAGATKVAAISVANPDHDHQGDEMEEFDASTKPPFSLGQIRAAIPNHCWERTMARSFSYVAKDVAIVIGIASVASFVDSWFLWPVYWLMQGTMFWALFVLGHDCGHGSFSASKTVNNLVGHVTHSFILVPYHGWRISHRTHHANHGHVENDESWYPMTEGLYKSLHWWSKLVRTQFPVNLFGYPVYLWVRTPGRRGSHYNPSSELFDPSEWKEVVTSTACWFAMVAILSGALSQVGTLWMLKLYFVPYIINVVWLAAVTYLHHHAYEKKVPWYRGKEWSFMRGGLSTIDRDYGFFNKVHHDIGTHVVHHLFPLIPHYHLCEATAAVKPLLGEYYREPQKSGPIPFHLIPIMVKSFSEDQFVADEGEIVFYQNGKSLAVN